MNADAQTKWKTMKKTVLAFMFALAGMIVLCSGGLAQAADQAKEIAADFAARRGVAGARGAGLRASARRPDAAAARTFSSGAETLATETLEAPPGFEPGIRDLQSRALPLGYGASASVGG